MATIRFVLRQTRKNRMDQSPLFVRINSKNKKTIKYIDIWLDPRNWNPKSETVKPVTITPRTADTHNITIQKIRSRFLEIIAELNQANRIAEISGKPTFPIDPIKIKKALFQEEEENIKIDFFEYVKIYLGRLEENKSRYNTFKKHRSVTRKFIKFIKEEYPHYKESYKFTDISISDIKRYKGHLLNKIKNSPNTVGKDIQELGAIFDHAIKEEITEPLQNPFRYINVKKEPVKKVPLTYSEIEKIVALDKFEKPFTRKVRDCFLFQIFTAGLRIGDLCTITKADIQDNGRIFNYTMNKTKNTNELELKPAAKAILNIYLERSPNENVFNLLSRPVSEYKNDFDLKSEIESVTTLYNQELKKIAKLAGITKNVTSHISRHTFAHMALSSGWDIYTIKTALRHSNISITEKYLRGFKDMNVDRKMGELFSNPSLIIEAA